MTGWAYHSLAVRFWNEEPKRLVWQGGIPECAIPSHTLQNVFCSLCYYLVSPTKEQYSLKAACIYKAITNASVEILSFYLLVTKTLEYKKHHIKCEPVSRQLNAATFQLDLFRSRHSTRNKFCLTDRRRISSIVFPLKYLSDLLEYNLKTERISEMFSSKTICLECNASHQR